MQYLKGLLFLFTLLCYYPAFSQIKDTISLVAFFLGGNDSLRRFVKKNFHEPDSIPNIYFTKKGSVRFVIKQDGTPGSFEIVEKVGYKYDEEMIRILKLTKWQPAIENGNYYEWPITYEYIITIDLAEN